jgi:hypothetical protein
VRLGSAVLCLALAGCASNGSVLTQQDVETYGRHRFDADPNRVYEASVGALRSQGYGIAYAQREAGLIKTSRKLVGVTDETLAPQGRYSVGGRWRSVGTYRQFQVNVQPVSPGVTEVTAVPFLFVGQSNVSNQDYWDLNAERAVWSALFAEMEQFLAAPKVIPPSPSGL